jgi:dihydropteroate synthase
MAKGTLANSEYFALTLKGRGKTLDLSVPRIMGILNVTPDSFFDGGKHRKKEDAFNRALQMVREGVDIIDVGGESTRPGAEAVSAEEEIDRVIPVIEALRREIDLPLSIDTYKSRVAAEAVAAGADFINDISGLQLDSDMVETVSSSGAGLFLMHTRGRPREMQTQTDYGDIIQEIKTFFRQQMEKAFLSGIKKEKIAIDPGIGFAKDAEGNLKILKCLGELKTLGVPILLGTSRKSFIGRILNRPDPKERLYGSLATIALGVQAGARIFRVHDVAASRDAAMTAWAICLQGDRENLCSSGRLS